MRVCMGHIKTTSTLRPHWVRKMPNLGTAGPMLCIASACVRSAARLTATIPILCCQTVTHTHKLPLTISPAPHCTHFLCSDRNARPPSPRAGVYHTHYHPTKQAPSELCTAHTSFLAGLTLAARRLGGVVLRVRQRHHRLVEVVVSELPQWDGRGG